jgi:hypothetical protein
MKDYRRSRLSVCAEDSKQQQLEILAGLEFTWILVVVVVLEEGTIFS